MRRMGFVERWVRLVMKCLTTVTYSVIINRNPVGCIRPTRGIRQGDSLSPYLFLLCVEVLVSNSTRQNVLALSGGGGPKLNHLFFADDNLILCKATSWDWHRLAFMLEGYERASGQRLNTDKIAVSFSRNTSAKARVLFLT